MTTVKGLLKKITTIKGVATIFVIMFVMNMTYFGRTIMGKIKALFAQGMKF